MQENIPTPVASPLIYRGKTGELFKIFFLNLFLGIITLGIYHFWGKTRVRRYLANHFILDGDPLEYTGTGSDLFFGLIKAFMLIGILSIPFFWAVYKLDTFDKNVPSEQATQVQQAQAAPNKIPSTAKTEEKMVKLEDINLSSESLLNMVEENQTFFFAVFIVIIYIIFYNLFLPFLAIFSSLKYRASRIQWRGINGYLAGSSIPYSFYGFFHTILKLITFGLWIPFADLMVYRYKMRRLHFGSQIASFQAKYANLFLTHLATIFISLILIIPFMTAFSVTYYQDFLDLARHPEKLEANVELVIYLYSVLLLSLGIIICMIILPRFWYKAALMRAKYNGLSFGNLTFSADTTGWQYARLKLGNFFIYLFTLGLASPWARQRRMRFFSKHVQVKGLLSEFMTNQSTMKKTTGGEGLSSLFDIEIGLF